tara:strand:+ start:738 stop:1115 length:378 start_codon:yes stop_codon:yes gene_type:complete
MQYFKYEEFDSPDEPGSGSDNMCPDFLELLDFARGQAGIPFKINSGYRTESHNKKLAKSSNKSSHLVGKAVDIACSNARDRFIIIRALIDAGFDRIGVSDSFIHVDSDTLGKYDGGKVGQVIWTY